MGNEFEKLMEIRQELPEFNTIKKDKSKKKKSYHKDEGGGASMKNKVNINYNNRNKDNKKRYKGDSNQEDKIINTDKIGNVGLHLFKCTPKLINQNILNEIKIREDKLPNRYYRDVYSRLLVKKFKYEDINKSDVGEWEDTHLTYLENRIDVPKEVLNRHNNVIESMSVLRKIKSEEIHITLLENMVIGLGETSVNEVSMKLHHTYGIPYLSGSALKGLLREYINQIDNDEMILTCEESNVDSINKNFIKRIAKKDFIEIVFGTKDDKSSDDDNIKWQGAMTFIDFFPEGQIRIVRDIMNSHLSEYYKGKGEPVFESANPIFFHAVEKNPSLKENY